MKALRMHNVILLSFMLVCLCTAPVYIAAQTNVSGLINTNTIWTLNGSPYIVTDDILVLNPAILTVEPGVVVKFETDKVLQVRGTLRAIGDSVNKITFTSNAISPAPSDWDYILFESEAESYDPSMNTGCIMKYCILEYGGDSVQFYNGTVTAIGSNPRISKCIFRFNEGCGLSYNNLTDNSANVIIDSCAFFYNQTGAWVTTELNNCEITNCVFKYNDAAIFGEYICNYTSINDNVIVNNSSSYYTVIMNIQSNNVNTSITNNRCVNNGLFSISSMGTANISDNVFCNNMNISIGAGNSLSQITRNIFVQNETSNPSLKKQVIELAGGDVDISKNIIANNFGSIVLEGSAASTCSSNLIFRNGIYSEKVVFPEVGAFVENTITENYDINTNDSLISTTVYFAPATSFQIAQSNIFNNFSSDSMHYEVYNANDAISTDIDVRNNWWGVQTSPEISELMWDWFDDNNYGLVNYTPFLLAPDTNAPISPPTSVSKADLGGGNVLIAWNNNPEQDLAGYKIYWGNPTCCSFSNSVNVGNVTSYVQSGVFLSDTIAVTAYDNLVDNIDDQFDGNESWYAYASDTTAVGIVDDIPKDELVHIYPNPFVNYFYVIAHVPAMKGVSLNMYDIDGKQVRRINNIKSPNFRIERGNLLSGMYFILVMNKDEIIDKRKVIAE